MKKETFNPFEKLDRPALIAALDMAEDALRMVDQHKYSVSRLYGAHNALFGINETPQACGSCLESKAVALRAFMGSRAAEVTAARELSEDEYKAQFSNLETIKPGAPPQSPAPSEKGGQVVTLEDGTRVMFDATGTNRRGDATGVVTAEVGKTLKPGTYNVKTGGTLSVQPGGKATLKVETPEAEEDLT